MPKIGGRVNFLSCRYHESHRVVLNAIELLLGIYFIDLSRMEWMGAKIRQKYACFLADLAKFTKNALKTVECYLKANHLFFYFHFQCRFSLR